MVFQFYCPDGHLLQGEESQAGATIACPVCKMEFIIPQPAPKPPEISAVPPPPKAPSNSPQEPSPEPPLGNDLFSSAAGFPGQTPSNNPLDFMGTRKEFVIGQSDYTAAKFVAPKTATTVVNLHIPCPGGHILQVTRDLLGEEAICPQCQREFTLRYEKSLEYQKEKTQRETLQAAKFAKTWLTWAVAAAVGVLVLILILIYS